MSIKKTKVGLVATVKRVRNKQSQIRRITTDLTN